MMALHDTGDLTCPRCGTSLAGLEEKVEAFDAKTVDEIRIHVDCPDEGCDAPLAIVIESALPEAVGVDIWVEDRRDNEAEP